MNPTDFCRPHLSPHADGTVGVAEAQMPDIFPLSTQIRFACVQALEGMYRLQDRGFPPLVEHLLEQGCNARERLGSLATRGALTKRRLRCSKRCLACKQMTIAAEQSPTPCLVGLSSI